jgi:hypothetical protein
MGTSLLEKRGPWVLAGAALVAWSLAVWQAEHDAVAAAWAVAGFVLVAAAAFFSRVVEISREGVKLRDVAEAFEAAERAPVAADDTTDEVKAKVLDEAWYSLYQRAVAEEARPDPYRRATLLERAWRESNLVATFGNWLGSQGWNVRTEQVDERFRTDVIGVGPDGRQLRAEVRSAVAVLRGPDASAIANSLSVRAADVDRALVLREAAILVDGAQEILRNAGIDVYLVDPSTGGVRRLQRPDQ